MPASRLRSFRCLFVLAAIVICATGAFAADWRNAPATPAPPHRPDLIVNASPHIVPYSGLTPVVNLVGDEDGFGFGAGWNPPLQCDTFDNRGPEDVGVFDQRQPGSQYNSICSFSGSWTHSFAVPAGGVGQVTLSLRILGGQGSTAFCFASPCGCETPSQQILINGAPEPFFADPGCATTTIWTKTWQGAAANAVAGSGTMNVSVVWGNNAFAIDWSKVTIMPTVTVTMKDGDGQKGVIGNAVEKPLRVKVSTADPSVSTQGVPVTFRITSQPAQAAGFAVGENEQATTTTYSAVADANGIASATLRLGDKEGPYVVQVDSPLSTPSATPVTFTATAKKPASMVILKDTTDLADRADSYAVSSSEAATFFAIGLDTDGSKLGPVKCGWSVIVNGSQPTRGGGSVSPAASVSQTTFSPSQVGKVTLAANPIISGVSTVKADLFITKLYVEVDAWNAANPVDQLAQFIPGGLTNGSSILPTAMPQQLRVHVLTGASSRGSITFTLSNVSKYPGVAMNYPVSLVAVDDDVYFPGHPPGPFVANFSGTGDTVATILVNDYAAFAKLAVSIKSGKTTYTLPPISLPVDNDGNKIADRGWIAESATIPDPGLDPGNDEDNTPAMRPVGGQFLPNDGAGQLGDNLTNFEEYRGFVFFGQHVRTNPFHKDAFVEATDFGDDILFAYPGLPTSTHRVRRDEADSIHNVNANSAGLPGATKAFPNGHRDAVAVHIARGGLNPGLLGSEGCSRPDLFAPCVPPYARDATVYQGTIDSDALSHGVSDPALSATLRRSVLAHEVGHSHNLLHNTTPQCMMFGLSFDDYQGWGGIPVSFCTGVDTTIIDCTFCGTTFTMPATNFNETDTLRFKEKP